MKKKSIILSALLLTCYPTFGQSTVAINPTDNKENILQKSTRVVPTPNQYAAQQDEFIAFIHFGPNTFTRMEWGTGKEDPKIFDLKALDTDQWCEAIKAAGMKKVILTAKHHDGFCLWPSRYTRQGIISTDFKGDIVKDLSVSCQKYNLKLGIYLSPADLFQIENEKGFYGNLSQATERVIPTPVAGRPFANKTTFNFKVDDYNAYFLNQLFELLTEYGEIHEVWFDGAHPKRKGNQQYNYEAWKKLIRTLAPRAVIFGREDIRWCGNESGDTRETEWNVIPYQENPDTTDRFPDMMEQDLGSREQLFTAKFLHYQPAETNTSIREGWFYRDDEWQQVRSPDAIFDMYERSVGGNSIFLLNIPPNRHGRFSDKDVRVLHEVGNRIRETYGHYLLANYTGKQETSSGANRTITSLTGEPYSFEFSAGKVITINRMVLQEPVNVYGECIEAHELQALIDNQWKTIAKGTNIGYKRILRFPEVKAQKFRINVLQCRSNTPRLSNITGHYYVGRPPQLYVRRDHIGNVAIEPVENQFAWKSRPKDFNKNLHEKIEIRYTTDGTEPNRQSLLYEKAFFLPRGEVKAVAYVNGKEGSISRNIFGLLKNQWKIIAPEQAGGNNAPSAAIDNDPKTYWHSASSVPKSIEIDLKAAELLKGFVYTPPQENKSGTLEGHIYVSQDGKRWGKKLAFSFGNLVNDPTPRTHMFKEPISAKYVKIEIENIESKSTASIAEIDFL